MKKKPNKIPVVIIQLYIQCTQNYVIERSLNIYKNTMNSTDIFSKRQNNL